MPVTYSAPTIITLEGPPLTQGWLRFDDEHRLIDIGEGTIPPEAICLEGLLCPGFINTHCHLELSHLKGEIPPHSGMSGFIRQVLKHRDTASPETRIKAMHEACAEMKAEGIVAVGDICNESISLEVKKNSGLLWRNFIELSGLDPNRAGEIYRRGEKTKGQLEVSGKSSLSPHAPYSLSDELMKSLINDEVSALLSIHMMESEDEIQFCKYKTGPLQELFSELKLPIDKFQAHPAQSPLDTFLVNLGSQRRLLLIHATEFTAKEITRVKNLTQQVWIGLCPSANYYINQKYPPLGALVEAGIQLCVGTDSLASNTRLSMLHELYRLQALLPKSSLIHLLEWACLNGAKVLELDNRLGSLSIGKKPGLNLIRDYDRNTERLTAESHVKALLPAG